MQKKKSMNLNKDNIKILLCCHKPSTLPPDPDGIFLPIQVGAAISDTDLGMQRDDQLNGQPCDNISEKNKSYCELTAMYWAWKNIKKLYPDLEYIGLNHYRRYFSFKRISPFNSFIFCPENSCQNYTVDKKKLRRMLAEGFSIVAKHQTSPYPLFTDYSVHHSREDACILHSVVCETFPEYVDSFDKIMCGNKLSPCNMFITSWEKFDSYCTWLFKILKDTERRIDVSNYTSYQMRCFGFMAERLFNVWLDRNHIKTKFLNVYVFDDLPHHGLLAYIARYFRNALTTSLLRLSLSYEHTVA